MNTVVQKNINLAKEWLSKSVFPIWFEIGFDFHTGCFVECFSSQGEPLWSIDRRAMVQARQIYSLVEAVRLNLFEKKKAKELIQKNIYFIIKSYALPDGAFAHSVDADLKISKSEPDLYTQAFILFGLAKAYEILKDNHLKLVAKKLLDYLNEHRRLKPAGYTEIKEQKILYQSNPHMHLFEAALAWQAVDSDECWKNFSNDLKQLCVSVFIDPQSGALAEHYSEPWQPQTESGYFIFEPGHHYEWSWLLLKYEQLIQKPVGIASESLFLLAEKYGLNQNRKFVVDEVLSNYQIKKSSSRFWPQCERIKAAVALGVLQPKNLQLSYAEAADQAFESLFKYFEVPHSGLWQDTLLDSGSFQNQPAKASSLYHIVNAISEYILLRPQFQI